MMKEEKSKSMMEARDGVAVEAAVEAESID